MLHDGSERRAFKKTMTKKTYIKEFGYEILEADESLLRLDMYILYFMEVYISQSELPNYMWN